MSFFTNWFWGITYRVAPSLFTQTTKVELAKSSISHALRIFSDQNPEDFEPNILKIDQVLEVVLHHHTHFKNSRFLSEFKYKIIREVHKQKQPPRENLLLSSDIGTLSRVLQEASLLSSFNNRLEGYAPPNWETQQKLLKLILIIAPECFSPAEKIDIAKKNVNLADFIFFDHRNKITNNRLSEEQLDIIRFYATDENRNKPDNKNFIDKLKRLPHKLLDADENLADVYLSHDLLNPAINIRTALLHAEPLLSKHWRKVKSVLLSNNTEGQTAREDFNWWLNEMSSALDNNNVRADKKENIKKIFKETLLLMYQDNDLKNYLNDALKNKALFLSREPSDASIMPNSSDSELSGTESSASDFSDKERSPVSSLDTTPREAEQSRCATPVLVTTALSKNNSTNTIPTAPMLDIKQQVLTELISMRCNDENKIFKKLAEIKSASHDKNIIEQAFIDIATDPHHPNLARVVALFIFNPITKDTTAMTSRLTSAALLKLFHHYQTHAEIIRNMMAYYCCCKELLKSSHRLSTNAQTAEKNLQDAYQLALVNTPFAEMLFSSYKHAKVLLNNPGIVKTAILLGKKHGEDFVKRHITTIATALSDPAEHEAFFAEGNLSLGNHSQHSIEAVQGNDIFEGISDAQLSRPPLGQLLCETAVFKKESALVPNEETNKKMINGLIKTIKKTYLTDPNCSIEVVDIQFNSTHKDPTAKQNAKTKTANAFGCTTDELDQSFIVVMDKSDIDKMCAQLTAHGIEQSEYKIAPVITSTNLYSTSEQSLLKFHHKSTVLFAQPHPIVNTVNATLFNSAFSYIFNKTMDKIKQVKSFVEHMTQLMSNMDQIPQPYYGPVSQSPPKNNTPAISNTKTFQRSVGFFPTAQPTRDTSKNATDSTGAQLPGSTNNTSSLTQALHQPKNGRKNNFRSGH